MATLVVQDAVHLQVSDGPLALDGTHWLTVADAAHLLVSDHLFEGFGEHQHLWMEVDTDTYGGADWDWLPWKPMTLPALLLNEDVLIATGRRIEGLADGSPLPELRLVAGTGMATGDPLYGGHLKIGVLTCSATASVIYGADTDDQASLPDLRIEAYAGAETDSRLKLPDLRITMAMIGTLVGSLDRSIPGFTLTATASNPQLMTLEEKLPPLTLSVTESVTYTDTLAANIPALKITASSSMVYLATLERNIPPPDFAEGAPATAHVVDMTVDVVMPTLVMGLVATGGVADGYSEASTGYETGRYTDYSMRHSR